jgi:hypothetical protein
MKIVGTDNFDGDYPNEAVIAENITSEAMAKFLCTALNEEWNDVINTRRYYKVVPDEYKLKSGFEP